MDGFTNHDDVWIAVTKDRTQAHLREVALSRITRQLRETRVARRTWISQQAGRLLRGIGSRMVVLGKQLECDEQPALHPKAA